MYHPNPPSHPPALIETLAVWGWAVEHGRIPLPYAAGILADHASYLEDSGVPDPTELERRTWATEDLTNWEDLVAQMAWPGDEAVDEEHWGDHPDWRTRNDLLRHLGLSHSPESIDRMLLRHCIDLIAECERRLAEQPDTRTEKGA